MSADTQVLFRLEADASGAVRGFTLSREELEKLRKTAEKTGQEAGKSSKGMDKLGRSTEKTGKQAKTTTGAMRALKRAVAAVFTIAVVRQAVEYADTMKNLEARLKIVTGSEEALARAREGTFAIAQRTSASLESTIELYARLELSLKGTGVAQEAILQVTETLNQALVVSGASAQEANAAIIQLSQGLASGALRGDEFRSVAEQTPRILQALQASLGKTRGELKKLADEGKLTTEVIVAALLEQSGVLSKEYAEIPITVGRAFVRLRNEALKYTGGIDDLTEASAKFAEMILVIAQNLDTILKVALVASAAVLAGFIAKAVLAAEVTLSLSAALAFLAGPAGIILLVAAAFGVAAAALIDWTDKTEVQIVSIKDLSGAIAEATTELAAFDAVMEAVEQRNFKQHEFLGLEKQIDNALGLAEANQAGRPDLASIHLERAKALQQAQEELRLGIAILAETIAEGRDRVDELSKAQKDAAKTARELLDAQQDAIQAAKDYADAVKVAEKAVAKGGTAEQKITLLRKQNNTVLDELRKNLRGTVGDEELLAAAIVASNKALQENINKIRDGADVVLILKDAINALVMEGVDPLTLKFSQLEVMLEEVENKFGEMSPEADQLRERIRLLRLEMEGLDQAGQSIERANQTAGGFFAGLRQNLDEAFLNGGVTIGEAITKSIKDNPLGAANAAFDAIANFQALKDQGLTTLDALNKTLMSVPIPEVQAIAMALDTINTIFGGGLFGTSYKTTESRRGFSITGEGAGGSIDFDQKKKKSFFRGTSSRTVSEALDAQTQDAINDLFNAALDALQGAVEALGVTAPDFIAGKFKEVFDADGNLVSSISTFFGQTYNESFDDFGKRLIAEQIIAAVGAATGDVEVQQALRGPGAAGRGFGDVFGANIADLVDQSGIAEAGTVLVNEAHNIAERWRDDAELLLEGAQFLLAAQTAIQDGNGLLDSLTQTVDIVEELANAGETLIDTYIRLVLSVEIMEGALDLMGTQTTLAREEFVRFAEAFTDAAGGIARASELWQSYFETFYAADELIEARLAVAREAAGKELGDIGLDLSVTKDQFRALFEAVLPSLSASALAEWLEAASALGLVIDLEGKLNEARMDGLSIDEQLTSQISLVDELRQAYDGSTASHRALITAVGDLANMMDVIGAAFEDARAAVKDITGSLINDLRRETMTDQAIFEEIRADALARAGTISGADSRGEVLDIVNVITSLVSDARGLVDGTQLNEFFINFLNQVTDAADNRLVELKDKALTKAQFEIDQVAATLGFITATDTFTSSVESLPASIDAFGSGIGDFVAAVSDFRGIANSINTQQPDVNVIVSLDESGGYGGNAVGLT